MVFGCCYWRPSILYILSYFIHDLFTWNMFLNSQINISSQSRRTFLHWHCVQQGLQTKFLKAKYFFWLSNKYFSQSKEFQYKGKKKWSQKIILIRHSGKLQTYLFLPTTYLKVSRLRLVYIYIYLWKTWFLKPHSQKWFASSSKTFLNYLQLHSTLSNWICQVFSFSFYNFHCCVL